jgi:hypothetical protein
MFRLGEYLLASSTPASHACGARHGRCTALHNAMMRMQCPRLPRWIARRRSNTLRRVFFSCS